MNDDSLTVALDLLAPRRAFPADWDDVLKRAGRTSARPRNRAPQLMTRRRLLVALVALAALLIPLVALSASNDWNWWFSSVYTSTTAPVGTAPQSLGSAPSRVGPGGPAPAPLAGGPTSVETGTWDGKSWVLVAYLSKTDGVCFSVSPTETAHTNGRGAARARVGSRRTSSTRRG